jgi:CobQ-like glutamine amidotransferase family enzyme
MNTYGDWGNVMVLKKRLQWRNYKADIIEHRPGDSLKSKPDLIFFGGGQDSGQSLVIDDLHQNAGLITEWIEAGIPTLAVCGGYQLLGREFILSNGESLAGIGVLDLVTRAETERLIGNVIVESENFGTIVGFENHSGRTELGNDLKELGTVKKGGGNNGSDKKEGVIYKSTIGTYLHGPLLPKNPQVADWLIAKALGVSNKELAQLPDKFVDQARSIAEAR